jgi:transcriptional regulator with XRE-family HTH domain
MKTNVIEELGSRIRERRKTHGWTQEELAAKADIDRSYIGGVERGERNLTFTVLCQICSALGCDVSALTKGLPELDQ